MLLHRLPVDSSTLCSFSSGADDHRIEPLTRISLHTPLTALRVLDLAGALALGWAVFGLASSTAVMGTMGIVAAALGVISCWLLASHVAGVYDGSAIVAGRSQTRAALLAVALAFGPMLVAVAVMLPVHGAYEFWLPGAACAVAAWVMSTRLAWQQYLKAQLRRGQCLETAIVMARSIAEARLLAVELERQTAWRTRVAASIAIPGFHGSPTLGWIERAIHAEGIDRIMISESDCLAIAASPTLDQLRALKPGLTLLADNGRARGELGEGMPVDFNPPAFHEAETPLTRAEAIVKRTLDLAAGVAALLLTAPALLAIALAVKFDSPGPVLFKQKRVGLNGAEFSMWKFRTMYFHQRDETCIRQTSRDDPRVTPVGRFLRRTSLDELPQLVNVLRGDMSIVGPRPHAVGMTVAGRRLTELVAGYGARHRMKPGITGWAQVHGCRGEVDCPRKLRRRVALDCHYIDNWSFSMEVMIIMRTVTLLFADPHAY